MKSTVLKMLAGVSLLLVTGLGAATASASSLTTITGGNPSQLEPGTIDMYQNFVIVDGNNPIDASGLLTSWSYYAQYQAPRPKTPYGSLPANNTGQVELVVVQPGATLATGAVVTYVSAPSTPFISSPVSSSSDRVVTVPLPGGVWVQKGDEIGLYFIGPSVVPFTGVPSGGTSGSVLYTSNGYGANNSISMSGSLAFQGATSRTYAVSVSGVTGAGCKDGGYATLGFSNQGACVSAFATHGDVPIGAPGH